MLVAGSVAVTTVAVTGASQGSPGLDFLTSGHWVYNSELRTALHIDGGTKQVDAEVKDVDAPPGSQVIQTDTHGYVLTRSGTQQFGKSDLTAQDPVPDGTDEPALGLEAAGVAYSVKLAAGVVQRFGDNPAVISVDGPLGRPAYTADGTLWLHRQDTGQLCQLPTYADRISCPATVASGKQAAIVTVGDTPVVVDTKARTMAKIDDNGLGRPVSLGDGDPDLGDEPIVAANDVSGRLAILDPGKREVHLIDAGRRLLSDDPGQPGAPAEKAKLPPGRYTEIASAGDSVAVLDADSLTLRTFDRAGKERATTKLKKSAQPVQAEERRQRLFRGEDRRLYVDSDAGDHVLVVDTDGKVDEVDVTSSSERGKEPRPPVKPTEPTSTRTPPAKPTTRNTPPPSRPTVRPERPERTQEPERTKEPERTREPDNDRTTEPTKEPTKPPTSKPTRPRTPAAQRPGAPSSVSATAGNASAVVRWGAADGNGAAVTGYRVDWRSSIGGGTKAMRGGSLRSTTVTGLTNGTSYTFTVRAENRVGEGQGRNSRPVKPVKPGRPGAPAAVNGVGSAGRTITVTWSPPSDGSTVTGYVLTYKQDHVDGDMTEQQGTQNLPAGTRRYVIRNTYADPYDITVAAANASGTGPVAKEQVTSGTAAAVTASRGADTTANNCEAPDCSYVRFVMQRFMPHSDYLVTAHSTRWPNYNEGGTWTTDENGRLEMDDEFPFAGVGQEVWVRVQLHNGTYIESNHVRWADR